MINTEPPSHRTRVVVGLAGLSMIGFGTGTLLRRGDMFYINWWGGLVFAPVAVVFGLFFIVCALFKPSWLTVPGERNHQKHR